MQDEVAGNVRRMRQCYVCFARVFPLKHVFRLKRVFWLEWVVWPIRPVW